MLALALTLWASSFTGPQLPARPRARHRELVCCSAEPPAERPLARLAETLPLATSETNAAAAACDAAQLRQRESRLNALLAIASPLAAAALYAYQRANPVNPIALLQAMESESPDLSTALSSGKGTLVEFYAPWCESCKLQAPSMRRFEKLYGDRVNFVTVNGDDPRNRRLVETFGVDSIPHLALISGSRQLQATLIGSVPDSVIERQLRDLAAADGRSR